jgi:5-methylcytosine-specific restriction protein A
MSRVRISNTRRAKLFADKAGICHLCGSKVQSGEAWDVSHPIALAIGGSDDETNWDVAHRKCHRTHTATHDQPLIAKVERMRMKHEGSWRSRTPMRRPASQERG